MHDAVRVVDRNRAVLAQTLPLESGAEGADLVLLILLLLGKLHEHLRDKDTGEEDMETLGSGQTQRQPKTKIYRTQRKVTNLCAKEA